MPGGVLGFQGEKWHGLSPGKISHSKEREVSRIKNTVKSAKLFDRGRYKGLAQKSAVNSAAGEEPGETKKRFLPMIHLEGGLRVDEETKRLASLEEREHPWRKESMSEGVDTWELMASCRGAGRPLVQHSIHGRDWEALRVGPWNPGSSCGSLF